MLMSGHSRNHGGQKGRCDMTASLALLYVTFLVGVGVLVAAWAWGDLPEQGPTYFGRSPLKPDLRHVLVMAEVVEDEARHTPVAPLGRHA